MRLLRVLAVLLGVVFVSTGTVGASLVTNGGFETGDFSGWTTAGYMTHWEVGVDHWTPVHSGTYIAYFGARDGWTFISQSIPTTPGMSYTVEFWLHFGFGNNDFQALWNGEKKVEVYDAILPDWTLYTYEGMASGTSAEIRFAFFCPNGFFRFDDVSATEKPVVPVPPGLLLLAPGLLGLIGIRRKLRK